MNRSDGDEIPVFTGLPAPEYMQSVLVLSARLKNKKYCVEELDERLVCQGIMIGIMLGIMTGIMLGIMLRILLRVLIDMKGFWSSAEFQEPEKKSRIILTFSTVIGLMRDIWYMRPLPDSGKLRMTLPDKPKSWNQKIFQAWWWLENGNSDNNLCHALEGSKNGQFHECTVIAVKWWGWYNSSIGSNHYLNLGSNIWTTGLEL